MISFSSKTNNLAKRAFDLVAAVFGLILLSPAFALIAILIKRNSPGPVFYHGLRIGQYGRIFKMLKFRTMYENEASYAGPRVTGIDDDRITPLGKWLRHTKLNELPQLWNVLIGEMSLVGPRPEDPSIARTWPTRAAREILSVRPGVTSPASILYRDEESMLQVEDVMRKYLHDLSPDKMRLDQLYVRHHSFFLDIDVILWTVLLLLPKFRAYSPPEQLLFVGPISRLIERYIRWFLWDFLTVLICMAGTGAVVRLFGPLNIGWIRAIQMALGFSALHAVTGLVFRTNQVIWSKATFWELGRLGAGWLLTSGLVLGVHYTLGAASLRSFSIILVSSMLSLTGIVFIRYRQRLIDGFIARVRTYRPSLSSARERVIIVGSGRTAEHVAWLMDHPAYSRKFQIVGFVDHDLRSQGMRIYGSRVIGTLGDISSLVQKWDVGLIILADSRIGAHQYREFRELASFKPARVVVAPDVFGSLSGLDGSSGSDVVMGDLNAFQCQHCLARYAARNNTAIDLPETQQLK